MKTDLSMENDNFIRESIDNLYPLLVAISQTASGYRVLNEISYKKD